MAIECGFFNSVNGDRKYNAEDMSRYFEHILSGGLFEHIDKCMLVTAAGGMEIAVAPGAGLIDCHWFRMKTTETLTIGTANAALPRIDAVVLRMDTADSVRAITLQVVAGVPASSPVAYAPQKSETAAEIVIAHVYVPAAASAITAEDITDTRDNENICGWVHSLVSLTDAPLLRRVSCQHTATANGETVFPITAAAYIPAADTVNVYVNGFYMTADIDYTVDKDAKTITLAAGVDAGTLVTIEVYKSISPDHVPEAVETVSELIGDVSDLKATNAENLLHNSNFREFVAQAGIAGKHGAQIYAGDRWKLTSGSVTGTANASGNGYSRITLNGTISQVVDNAPAAATPAVKMISGTATITYENGVVTITSAGGVLDWAVLLEGVQATPTAYKAKGYAVELLTCQRYFVRTRGGAGFVNAAETIAYIECPLPVTMRAAPTVEVDITSVRGGGIYYAQSAVTSITVNSFSATMPVLMLTVNGAFTGGKYQTVFLEGTVHACADL